jgi:hypothetical protein
LKRFYPSINSWQTTGGGWGKASNTRLPCSSTLTLAAAAIGWPLCISVSWPLALRLTVIAWVPGARLSRQYQESWNWAILTPSI